MSFSEGLKAHSAPVVFLQERERERERILGGDYPKTNH
jgi:hypothetical protein